jgi:hypothetical protein
MKVKIDGLTAKHLIDYMYHDEQKDWAESGEPDEHIYHDVEALNDAYDAAYSNNDIMLDRWYAVQGADLLFKAAIDAGFDLEQVRSWIKRL